MTLTELVDIWVEGEIKRRFAEIDLFHADIVAGSRELGSLKVLPLRGGVHEKARSVEVLVEVRDRLQRRSRIGAWEEAKRDARDDDAFHRAYTKATAHAVVQLLPASVWRRWTSATLGL